MIGLRWFAQSKNTWSNTDTLIHGNARGADQLSESAYKEIFFGYEGQGGIERFPADWNKYGKRAGYIRNKQMLEEGKPDIVLAFPGGKGTAMMVRLAKEAGVRVIEVS